MQALHFCSTKYNTKNDEEGLLTPLFRFVLLSINFAVFGFIVFYSHSWQ